MNEYWEWSSRLVVLSMHEILPLQTSHTNITLAPSLQMSSMGLQKSSLAEVSSDHFKTANVVSKEINEIFFNNSF